MKEKCVKYLQYITEAIPQSFEIVNKRLEEIAQKNDISNEEYCQIYEQVIMACQNY